MIRIGEAGRKITTKNIESKNVNKIELIDKELQKAKLTKPVVIPSAINMQNVKKAYTTAKQDKLNSMNSTIPSVERNSSTMPRIEQNNDVFSSLFEETPANNQPSTKNNPVPEYVEPKSIEQEYVQPITLQQGDKNLNLQQFGKETNTMPENEESNQTEPVQPVKKGRGRPRKEKTPEEIAMEEAKVKKGRGRPKKIVESEETVEPEAVTLPETENTSEDEMTIEEKLAQLSENLDDSQLTAVLTTVDDAKEYALKKQYVQDSIYMQLDPMNVAQEELIYNIQEKDENGSQRLGTIYRNTLNSVGLYDWIEQQTGLEAAYVGELVSVSVDSGLTLTNGEPLTIGGSDSLKIIIRGVDAESCGKIAEAVKTYMEQQQGNLNTRLGSHELVLLSEVSGNIMNMDVMNQQTAYRNSIYGLETAIAAAKAAFSEDQKQYYTLLMKENGLEDTTDAEQSIVEEEQLVPENPAVSKKYVVLGAVLFAFIYAAVLCMGYIFNSRIRVNDGLQDLYGIPQIGVVVKDSKKKLFLDRWVNGLRHYGKREFTAEQSMELVFAAIKIAAAKNGQNSICLMGCNLGAGADKVCEGLKAALEKEGLSVTILNNVLYDAEAMEKVSAGQGAVLVEKAGSTLYNEIVAELELLKRLEIPVLGGITVE